MSSPIYLDYMATTPIDPEIADQMFLCLKKEDFFGNSTSENHRYGWKAQQLIENSRESVANLVNADSKEIIWTSGATESNNLAIKGALDFYQRRGNHMITLSTEHKAVLNICSYLASRGFAITYLDPEPSGLLKLECLRAAIRPDTVLVSIMHVNNETGVIQDIDSIGKITRNHGILLHVDAAQSAGKIPINLKNLFVDLMSFSAHKIYGPKGIGALYIRRTPPPQVHLTPLIHGGGHEKGLRSGTLPTHQIVGMGRAFDLAKTRLKEDTQYATDLNNRFLEGLTTQLEGVHINGEEAPRIPNCLNVYFDGIEGDSLLLSLQKIAVSSRSACNSAESIPSHVLTAMGLSHERAHNSIRISFGRFTTKIEIDQAVLHIIEQVNRLRQMSPIWDAVKIKVMSRHYFC